MASVDYGAKIIIETYIYQILLNLIEKKIFYLAIISIIIKDPIDLEATLVSVYTGYVMQ